MSKRDNIEKRTVRKFVKKIFYKFLKSTRIHHILTTLNNIENQTLISRQVTNNEGVFLEEAKVFNAQNNSEKIIIGQGSYIRGELLIFPYGGYINIGSNCYVGEGTRIWSGDSIIIGNNVMIGHNVNLIDFAHESNSVERAIGFKNLIEKGHPTEKGNIPTRPIVIEDNVIIYAGASIVMGVTIGKASIISTGSVVIRDVPPYSQVIGNPAKVVWRTK